MKHKPFNHFYYESPDGLRYTFDGRLQAHDGIGLIAIKFIEDYGPQQDGTTIHDWRMNPRTINLDVFLQGEDCCGTRGEQLAEMINIIRPNRGATRDVPGWLRFFNDAAVLMEIPVFVMQGPSGNYKYDSDIGRYQVEDGIQFYAADPVWREYEQIAVVTTFENDGTCLGTCLGSITDQVEGMCLGFENAILSATSIVYVGTWNGDQIDITLVGPMENPIIENLTQGTRIELLHTIASGEYVTITIRPEYVTVIDSNGDNLIGSISSISDLVDFVLLSPGQTTPTGLNEIVVFAVSPDIATSQLEIDYWTRHISAYGTPQC